MRETLGLQLAVHCGARPNATRYGPGSMRVGGGFMVIALVSALLAACAGTDGEVLADGTPVKEPVKVSAAKAAPRKAAASKAGTSKAGLAKASRNTAAQRPVASSITTASISKASAATVVDLPYRPEVGSRWIGVTEMRETKSKGGSVVESMVLRDRGEYRIVEKLENGYRVSYTLHDGSIDGDAVLAELMKPLIQSMIGQSYAYETDEGGTPTRVIDVDRLKALAIKAVDLMAESKPEFGAVPQLKQVVDGLRSQFDSATPETGVELFLQPVARLSMVQGLTNVLLGEERSYDDVVVNPLTGSKMRSRGSFKVAAIDKAKALATIEWRMTVLPEDLNKATRELVMRFVPEGADAKKLDDAMAQLKMEHLDRASYQVALADGVVRRMDRTAIVKAQGVETKTVMTMTLTPAR
jgi:hypothetical protein